MFAVNWPPHDPADGQATISSAAQVLVADRADGVLADRLEHVLHGHVLAAEPAGQNAAAVHEDRRHVEAHHRHHQAGQRLVAAGEPDQRVVGMAAHRELGRIRDHLARDQRALHALMAHRDAVGDRDRGELARRAAGLGDAALGRLRLPRERDVAGCGLVPGRDHADERRRDVRAGQPHREIVGPVGRPVGPDGRVPARQPGLVEDGVPGHRRCSLSWRLWRQL